MKQLQRNPELEVEIQKSMKSPLELVNSQFQRMKLKDRSLKVAEAATKKKMDDVVEKVKNIDHITLEQEHMTKRTSQKLHIFNSSWRPILSIDHTISANVPLSLVPIGQLIQLRCPKRNLTPHTNLSPYLIQPQWLRTK